MENIELNRSIITKRWRIPDKFINYDFYNFLLNSFNIENDSRRIIGFGSVQEYADYFQLQEHHGITLKAILKLLNDKCCIIELNKKENLLKYQYQDVEQLRIEIEARIKK